MTLREYTNATAVAELVRLVVTLYLTVAIMGIGFATMVAGSNGASAAARLFFVRPVQMVWGAVLALFALVFGSVWAGLAGLLATLIRALRRELREVAADFRWLVARFDR